MKKFFKEHTIAKLLGILIFVAVLLSWFIPYSSFQGSKLVENERMFIGLHDITQVLSTSISFIIDKIIFILAVGGFYAVLSSCDGYKKLVNNIAKKIKGKEVLFALIISIVITLLTSVMTQSFVIILFIPFVISVLRTAGINKITAFATTFGAMLVGVLGATYGTEGLNAFDTYLTGVAALEKSAMELTLAYRIIILLIGTTLYNFFLYFAVKKSLTSKAKDENKDDEFIVENVKAKDAKTFPIIIIFVLALVFTILGYVDWSGIFKLNIFNDFHEWLIGLKVGKDFPLMYHLLGNTITAFGTWTLLNISVVVIILSILVSILYSIKIDEFFTRFGNGAKNLVKPIGVLVAIYAIFVTTYMGGIMPKITKDIMSTKEKPVVNIDYNGAGIAIFNIDVNDDFKPDENLINQDKDKDGKCDLNCDTNKDGYPDAKLDFDGNGESDKDDEAILSQLVGESTLNYDSDSDGIPDVNITTGFNLFKVFTGSVITNIFNVDLGYTAYSSGTYLVGTYGAAHLKLIVLVIIITYALVQLALPTGIILAFGLTYTKNTYVDWLKYAWRYILGMLCIVLLVFIFILIM